MNRSAIRVAAPFFAAPLLLLAGCGGKGDDALASDVEAAADNQSTALQAEADRLEAQAEATADRAETVRDAGEDRADAIDAADVDADAMTAAQRNAVIANESAAVR